jgi:FkbM family methyltransferase
MESKAMAFSAEPARAVSEGIAVPTSAETLAAILSALPDLSDRLAPETATYRALATAARACVVSMFGPDRRDPQQLPPFGPITFPYHRMGAVDSLNLFDMDELIIFAFYWANRGLYRRVADVGANIGLHSLIMARCGFEVTSYEPDPLHLETLKQTLRLNKIETVAVVAAAVSNRRGEAEFVRLKGNTTGSHLAGAKPNPYGEIERFMVNLVPASDIIGRFDLVKIDAEGHEAQILLDTRTEHWTHSDAILEVGSQENAVSIFDHCNSLGLHIFTQKTGWRRARARSDLPTSYREGSAFVTRREIMPGMRSG